MRSVAAIDADLETIRAELARLTTARDLLLDERKAAIPARDTEIIRLFDAGRDIKAIATELDTTVNAVWTAVRKTGRTAKSRAVPISHLPAEQQRVYHKARRWGRASPAAARQIAQAVTA